MKLLSTTIAALLISFTISSQSLKVSNSGRYFETKDGDTFLWLGDTAWELFHRLDREEATHYLTTRANQGFTLIQAVVLAENEGLRVPNSYGEVPLIDLSPEKPNEKYFEHVDFIINKANDLGLYVGVLPTWGDKVYSNNQGAGPIIFNEKNAEVFGEFLGKRYIDKNIIWILGGDRNIANDEVFEIWKSMAKGLRKGDQGKHLITYHPRGGKSSSIWFQNEDWLDFNMYQTGHGEHFNPVYRFANADYSKTPIKPFVEGEPAYEDIPVKFWVHCDWSTSKKAPDSVFDKNGLLIDQSFFKEGFFTDYDVRVHGYWNFLSGACGYTYGNNAVWQMYKKGGPIAIPCLTDWEEALYRKGATQIIHMRNLFDVRPVSTLIPDQFVIRGQNREDKMHIRAARNINNTSLIIYLAQGQTVEVVLNKIDDPKIIAHWFNPRNGKITDIGKFENRGTQKFIPPTSGLNNDWVLILDSKKAKLELPNSAN